MSPAAIISTLEGLGIEASLSTGGLALSGQTERLTDELRRAIRADAVGLRIALSGRLFIHPRLCYYVKRGDAVETPHGPATVLQVFADRITVRARGEKKARFYVPEEIMLKQAGK